MIISQERRRDLATVVRRSWIDRRCVNQSGRPTSEGRSQACGVTYVTNNELGFDYLRDHLAYETEELTLTTRLNFAIVMRPTRSSSTKRGRL